MRRLVLVWSAGATVGYLVGWLAGSNVLRMAEGHRLARPEPRTPSRTGMESREVGNGAQSVFLCGLTHHLAGVFCTLPRGHGQGPIPAQRSDAPCPVSSPTHHLPCIRVGAHDEHWWRDPRPACPQYSPGGGIPCSVTGEHTAHIFLGSAAPDRKDDADEEVE